MLGNWGSKLACPLNVGIFPIPCECRLFPAHRKGIALRNLSLRYIPPSLSLPNKFPGCLFFITNPTHSEGIQNLRRVAPRCPLAALAAPSLVSERVLTPKHGPSLAHSPLGKLNWRENGGALTERHISGGVHQYSTRLSNSWGLYFYVLLSSFRC